MTEVLKTKQFEWIEQAQKASEEIKLNLTSVPIPALPSFSKIFEVKCDVSDCGDRGCLVSREEARGFVYWKA